MNSKWKKIIRRCLMVIFIVYITIILYNQYMQIRYIEKQKYDVLEQIAKEKETNDYLHHQLDLVNTDQYIEKVAREQLGMVKDGEVKYINDDFSNGKQNQ